MTDEMPGKPTGPESAMPRAQMRSELEEFLDAMHQRRRVFPRAALVGVGAGLLAALFRFTLAGGDNLRDALINWAHSAPVVGWLAPIAFCMVGAVGSVALVRGFAPEAAGSGIPHLKGVLHRLRKMDWRRILPVKFLSGALAIGGGLALGREGPTVQMGGSFGDAVADWLRSSPEERRTLIAAGAGAGLAAAFNAPLAGVIFVLEELRRDFHPIVFGAAFLAAAIADIIVRLLSGQFPVFSVPAYPAQPILSLPFFVVLGALAGLLGVVYNKCLLWALVVAGRADRRWRFASAAIVGAAVGVVGWFAPQLIGGGHAFAELILAGNVALAIVPLYFVVRFLLSTSSYATGAAGGIFAPLLVLGALIGLGVGELAHALAPEVVTQPGVFAVVGMAAYFTAIVRAPLTGIVLILEMTGNYEQMLPLLVTCFTAYVTAELLKDLPIYEALLERDLARGPDPLPLGEPVVLDFEVERGSPFAGKQVRSLGLPAGCVLVRAVDGGREFVPTASTRLEPHMRLTAFISPQAANAVEMLRHGCKSASKPEGADKAA